MGKVKSICFKGRSIILKSKGKFSLQISSRVGAYGKVEQLPVLEGKKNDYVCEPKKSKKRVIMSKQKTTSSAKKRFKVTGTIQQNQRKHAFKNHILTKKSKKRKLKLTHSSLVSDSDLGSIKKAIEIKIICITGKGFFKVLFRHPSQNYN